MDIGIVPSQGLVPPTLRIKDLKSSEISETKAKFDHASPATKRSCPKDMTSMSRGVNSQVRSKVVQRKVVLIRPNFKLLHSGITCNILGKVLFF